MSETAILPPGVSKAWRCSSSGAVLGGATNVSLTMVLAFPDVFRDDSDAVDTCLIGGDGGLFSDDSEERSGGDWDKMDASVFGEAEIKLKDDGEDEREPVDESRASERERAELPEIRMGDDTGVTTGTTTGVR